MNVDAVPTPENYKGSFNLNNYHRQNFIGNYEYLTKKLEKKYIAGNSSFISIPIPPHVNL
mgnify:CR=1 FL=1